MKTQGSAAPSRTANAPRNQPGSTGALNGVATRLEKRVADYCSSTGVPGYLVGVCHDGGQAVVAHGAANIATGAPMRKDTGFLFGSITKTLTTALVMQQVERGVIDLDERVVSYLPEFRLTTPDAADRIRVRHLLTHTNGIDADLLFVDSNGPGAIQDYLRVLADTCGVLFEPGKYVSYSNGGMIVAGRLLEVLTGTAYGDLLEREVFATVGMDDSCTSAEKAILRSTAVGHFLDPATQRERRTDMFKLPDSWAPAGATPIGTIADLLAFARIQLTGGLAASGRRLLSAESIGRMQHVWHDMRTPNVPPMGLGWLLTPFGTTTVLSMSGASPGGVAVLAVVPDHDLAFAAFSNDSRAMALHDELLIWLLEEQLNVAVPELVLPDGPPGDLRRYEGRYRSNQLRVDVRAVDGELEEAAVYQPLDDEQARIFARFAGGPVVMPPRRLVPVGANLFAPAGMPLDALRGYSRQFLVSYHGLDNRAFLRCAGGRMTRREQQG